LRTSASSKEWLDIFTEDVPYFMPRRKNIPRWKGTAG